MDMSSPLKTIQFVRGGQVVSLANVPPSRTLLEVLREDHRAIFRAASAASKSRETYKNRRYFI